MLMLTALTTAAMAQAQNDNPFEDDICDQVLSTLQPSMESCQSDVPLDACGPSGAGTATDWMVLPLPVFGGMEVSGVQYTLVDDTAIGGVCDAGQDHFVMVYAENWVTGATQIVETFTVSGAAAGTQDLFLTTPFPMGPGEWLKLAIRSTTVDPNACATGGVRTCVLGCDRLSNYGPVEGSPSGTPGNPYIAPGSETSPPFSVLTGIRDPQVGVWVVQECESSN